MTTKAIAFETRPILHGLVIDLARNSLSGRSSLTTFPFFRNIALMCVKRKKVLQNDFVHVDKVFERYEERAKKPIGLS